MGEPGLQSSEDRLGLGRPSVSELTHVYVGRKLQFLVSGSYCKISYDMASSRERDTREQERENDQDRSRCDFIT